MLRDFRLIGRCGLVWFGVVWFGLVWCGFVRCGCSVMLVDACARFAGNIHNSFAVVHIMH
jgi:hypothetical protein